MIIWLSLEKERKLSFSERSFHDIKISQVLIVHFNGITKKLLFNERTSDSGWHFSSTSGQNSGKLTCKQVDIVVVVVVVVIVDVDPAVYIANWTHHSF